jgi:hypothetical protein
LINGDPTLSKPGRVILTATTATQRAFASRQGLHFSDHLLTALRQGQHLFGAYWETRTALFASHRSREGDLWQLPWIDANGNGVPNEVDDALQASLRSFGGATPVTSAVLWPPTLADVRIITNVLQATIADNRCASGRCSTLPTIPHPSAAPVSSPKTPLLIPNSPWSSCSRKGTGAMSPG